MRDSLEELFSYCEKTGNLIHKRREAGHFRHWKYISSDGMRDKWNAKYEGKVAGWIKSNGYRLVAFNDKTILAHRAIWKMKTGSWPINDIDHINGNRADNRFENLREATRSENAKNTKRRSDNTSGISGVSWHSQRKKWVVRIKNKEGQSSYRGVFNDLESAIAVRNKIVKEEGFSERHGVDA